MAFQSRSKVYPRSCGETPGSSCPRASASGLSPLMRGNQPKMILARARLRSIPAHAGKPRHRSRRFLSRRVYPRSCGETLSQQTNIIIGEGLSPLMRGNRQRETYRPTGLRSIPAHAGKPRTPARRRTPTRVYPRSCGETPDHLNVFHFAAGLSPLMRGNRCGMIYVDIPRKVYPRSCGKPGFFFL